MAIDRGDWHFEDAGTWDRACRHIALFLWWAAERGLAGPEIDAKAMAKGPTRYFIKQCDTKLWDEDLGAEGNRFVKTNYNPYLEAVHAYAESHDLDDYEIPENAATAKHFFAWLDERLASWRKKPKKAAPAKKKAAPKKKAAKKPARKAAKKAVRKPARKVARKAAKKRPAKKPAKKAARKPARKAARKAAAKKRPAKKAGKKKGRR